MKPSHLRTPRTLSECYFVEGHSCIEPAMWRGRWNMPRRDVRRPSINWNLVGLAALGVLFITAPVIKYLI